MIFASCWSERGRRKELNEFGFGWLIALMVQRSMAEQLRPLATELRKRYAMVRPVSQVLLRLKAQQGTDRFAKSVETIVRWISGRAGHPLPKAAWAGESFELEEVGAQRTAAVALAEPRYWAARLDDADKTIPQRTWVTEIGLGADDSGDVLFGARLTCVTRGDDAPFVRSVPGFVRHIIGTGVALLDGFVIQDEPLLVDSHEAVDTLIRLLEAPERRADVIAFALPDGSSDRTQTIASALEIHRKTLAETARRTGNIVSLLATRAGRFPSWLRVLATARPNPQVLTPLHYAFDLKELDAESDSNQEDLGRYILGRAAREPLATVLKKAGKSPPALAEQLVAQSQGKFLLAVRALHDLERGHISVAELAALPPGMNSYYLDAFERRFRRAGRDYGAARAVLGVSAAAREPMPPAMLAAVLEVGAPEVQAVRQALPDLLRLRAVEAAEILSRIACAEEPSQHHGRARP